MQARSNLFLFLRLVVPAVLFFILLNYLFIQYKIHQEVPSPGEISLTPIQSEHAAVNIDEYSVPEVPGAKSILHSPELATNEQQAKEHIFKMNQNEATKAVQEVESIVYHRADTLFSKEALDPLWGPKFESQVREIFQQHAALSRCSIQHIECRSTQCQIIAYTPQSSDADFFSAALYSALEQQNDPANLVAAIARKMDSGVTSAYIARPGHELAFFNQL